MWWEPLAEWGPLDSDFGDLSPPLIMWGTTCWRRLLPDMKVQDDYMSYDLACSYFGVKKLTERRLELCTNFALKLYKSDKSAEFFSLANPNIDTRQDSPLVIENKVNTKRCYNAPHSYLSRLVNANSQKLKTSTK